MNIKKTKISLRYTKYIFLKWNCHRHHQLQSATLQQYYTHQVQNRHMMINTIAKEKWAEKLCWQESSNSRPCAPLIRASDSSVFLSLPANPAPWYSGWVVGLLAAVAIFTWQGFKSGMFKSISIQTAASHGLDYSTALPVPAKEKKLLSTPTQTMEFLFLSKLHDQNNPYLSAFCRL